MLFITSLLSSPGQRSSGYKYFSIDSSHQLKEAFFHVFLEPQEPCASSVTPRPPCSLTRRGSKRSGSEIGSFNRLALRSKIQYLACMCRDRPDRQSHNMMHVRINHAVPLSKKQKRSGCDHHVVGPRAF